MPRVKQDPVCQCGHLESLHFGDLDEKTGEELPWCVAAPGGKRCQCKEFRESPRKTYFAEMFVEKPLH